MIFLIGMFAFGACYVGYAVALTRIGSEVRAIDSPTARSLGAPHGIDYLVIGFLPEDSFLRRAEDSLKDDLTLAPIARLIRVARRFWMGCLAAVLVGVIGFMI